MLRPSRTVLCVCGESRHSFFKMLLKPQGEGEETQRKNYYKEGKFKPGDLDCLAER